MSSQELVTKQNNDESSFDLECPDCHALLTISYDDRRRYFCENCEQEMSAGDLDRDDGDNNIRANSVIQSYRGLF